MDSLIRSRMVELIDAVIDRGHCNFAEAISGRLLTGIFIGLLGMTMDDFDRIMDMEHRQLRGATPEIRGEAANQIFAYVSAYIESQAAAPGDNLAGALLRARQSADEPWTMEEIFNCASLLYIAGLDTVTNMMTFIWHRLASHPDERRYLATHLPRSMRTAIRHSFRTPTWPLGSRQCAPAHRLRRRAASLRRTASGQAGNHRCAGRVVPAHPRVRPRTGPANPVRGRQHHGHHRFAAELGRPVRRWRCFFSNHVYDEALGDPDSGIAPGTTFEDLPEDWTCPDCGVNKADFAPEPS